MLPYIHIGFYMYICIFIFIFQISNNHNQKLIKKNMRASATMLLLVATTVTANHMRDWECSSCHVCPNNDPFEYQKPTCLNDPHVMLLKEMVFMENIHSDYNTTGNYSGTYGNYSGGGTHGNYSAPYSNYSAPYGNYSAPYAPYGNYSAPYAPYGNYSAPYAPYGNYSAPYGNYSAPYAPYGNYSAPYAPYGNYSAPYGNYSAPYGNYSAPYGNYSAPYGNYSAPYGNYSAPYGNYSAPYGNYSAPYGNYSAPYGNYSAPYGNYSAPYGNYSAPYAPYGNYSAPYGNYYAPYAPYGNYSAPYAPYGNYSAPYAPYGNYSAPYAPYGNYSAPYAPYGNYSAPYGNYSAPYGNYSAPYAPYGNYSAPYAPYGNYSAPYGNYSAPYGNYSAPYGNYSAPYGNYSGGGIAGRQFNSTAECQFRDQFIPVFPIPTIDGKPILSNTSFYHRHGEHPSFVIPVGDSHYIPVFPKYGSMYEMRRKMWNRKKDFDTEFTTKNPIPEGNRGEWNLKRTVDWGHVCSDHIRAEMNSKFESRQPANMTKEAYDCNTTDADGEEFKTEKTFDTLTGRDSLELYYIPTMKASISVNNTKVFTHIIKVKQLPPLPTTTFTTRYERRMRCLVNQMGSIDVFNNKIEVIPVKDGSQMVLQVEVSKNVDGHGRFPLISMTREYSDRSLSVGDSDILFPLKPINNRVVLFVYPHGTHHSSEGRMSVRQMTGFTPMFVIPKNTKICSEVIPQRKLEVSRCCKPSETPKCNTSNNTSQQQQHQEGKLTVRMSTVSLISRIRELTVKIFNIASRSGKADSISMLYVCPQNSCPGEVCPNTTELREMMGCIDLVNISRVPTGVLNKPSSVVVFSVIGKDAAGAVSDIRNEAEAAQCGKPSELSEFDIASPNNSHQRIYQNGDNDSDDDISVLGIVFVVSTAVIAVSVAGLSLWCCCCRNNTTSKTTKVIHVSSSQPCQPTDSEMRAIEKNEAIMGSPAEGIVLMAMPAAASQTELRAIEKNKELDDISVGIVAPPLPVKEGFPEPSKQCQ